MDCRSLPESCHSKAKCKDTGVDYENLSGFPYDAYACQCNNGYLGNGFLCVKEPSDCTETCCNDDSALQIEKDSCSCNSLDCSTTTEEPFRQNSQWKV